MPAVHRITLFKIPSEADITALLGAYEVLKATNRKNNAPYIQSLLASRVSNTSEQRSQGYTVAVQSTFASRDDVTYYDNECEAHRELKKLSSRVHKGVCTLIMEEEQ